MTHSLKKIIYLCKIKAIADANSLKQALSCDHGDLELSIIRVFDERDRLEFTYGTYLSKEEAKRVMPQIKTEREDRSYGYHIITATVSQLNSYNIEDRRTRRKLNFFDLIWVYDSLLSKLSR